MIRPEAFFDLVTAEGIRFFAGVPDSLLKNLCACITDRAEMHIIAANEGNAVALAAGHFLATGKPGLVYMQNSGIGNAVNPLLSLADPEVYAVPVLLVIGWRGEPGIHDEPQHRKQGRVTKALLEAMEIPYRVIGPETDNPETGIRQLLAQAVKEQRPAALLVRQGTFEAYTLKTVTESRGVLNREEALEIILSRLTGWYFVSTTGFTSREVFEIREKSGSGHGQDFLTVGSMGHSSQIALGLVLSKPGVPVCCLDGDGGALMHLGALAINGSCRDIPLLHVVLNNGCHDSVGGQPTVGYQTDFTAMARAAGYKQSVRVEDLSGLETFLAGLNGSGQPGPVLLEIILKGGARKDLGRPTTTTLENRDDFMKSLKEVKA
jgi:phosphonopyruvate decarboxylase